jgi:CRISPR-associated protein Csm3
MPQLLKKIVFSGYVEALTGLMIGASNSGMAIGGPDKQVIRNPRTNLPYIPGSSLKGKMRSLLELFDGTFSTDGKYGPTTNASHRAAKLFGYINNDEKVNNLPKQRPSRLLVRDGELLNPEDFPNTDLPYTEAKTENNLNRITAAANPRTFERVPKGAKFALELVLNVFDDDNESELLNDLLVALRLVHDDYLGGGGSRGNGQVRFELTKVVERTAEHYRNNAPERNLLPELKLPIQLQPARA